MIGIDSRMTVMLGLATAAWGCGAAPSKSCETTSPQTAEPNEAQMASTGNATSGPTPKSVYQGAIKDAAVAESSEIHPLKVPTGDRVTVLTWVNDAYLSSYPVGNEAVLSWGDVWVTLVPEVQEKCRAFPQNEQQLRLQQLLGLPPAKDARSFVVLEANAADLFRPCIEPDIHALQCTTSGKTTDPNHALFFANQTAVAYVIPDGYPWTRLGYTFDWNPATPEYGASEYVVKKGSTVAVKAIFSTADYCR